MECRNHPETTASGRCTGCAEPFCENCLVPIQGKQYCAACKVMALQGAAPMVEEATIPCEEANQALMYSIVGLLCCGIILEPLAISKALAAKRMIAENPRLAGSGKATAALIIACIGLVLWVLGMIGRASMHR